MPHAHMHVTSDLEAVFRCEVPITWNVVKWLAYNTEQHRVAALTKRIKVRKGSQLPLPTVTTRTQCRCRWCLVATIVIETTNRINEHINDVRIQNTCHHFKFIELCVCCRQRCDYSIGIKCHRLWWLYEYITTMSYKRSARRKPEHVLARHEAVALPNGSRVFVTNGTWRH